MILFTNGCSWTYGGGLNLDHPAQTEQRLQSVWPYHLGALLNAEKVVNMAAGCGSNQRSARTTYDWILSQSPEDLAKTVAIIQVTEPSRYELHIPREDNDPDAWIKCKIGVVTADRHRRDLTDFHWDYNSTRLSLYSDIEGVYSVLNYCQSLTNLFKNFNIRHYFWNGGFFNHKEQIVPPTISNYFEQSVNWFNSNAWQYQRISPSDQHPSFEGHKEIAKLMFENMNNPGSRTG